MRLLSGVMLTAGCAAIAVTGCASVHMSTGSLTSAESASRAATRSPAVPSSARSGSLRQRAVADAAAILASFVPPPGARRLTYAPGVASGALTRPWSVPQSATLVDDVSWWRAPGQPDRLLAWEKARLSGRFALVGAGYGGIGGVTSIWGDTFSLAAVPGVLTTRDLVVEAVGTGHGQTAIRVDAEVVWRPAHGPRR